MESHHQGFLALLSEADQFANLVDSQWVQLMPQAYIHMRQSFKPMSYDQYGMEKNKYSILKN